MRIHAIMMAAGLALAACSDDKASTSETSTGSDATSTEVADSESPDLTGKSAYHVIISTSDGDTYDLGLRDLTDQPQYFAFGSSHIAPAVSFAMTDSVTFPRTINFTLDFGIVVPSDDHPIATSGPGDYPFTAAAPSSTVFVKGLQYRSVNTGSSGGVQVVEWSTETGGVVAGTFSGTLVADGPTGKTVDIDGYYHFILPTKDQGQPR